MLHNQRKNRFFLGNDAPTYIIFGPEHKKYGIKPNMGATLAVPATSHFICALGLLGFLELFAKHYIG